MNGGDCEDRSCRVGRGEQAGGVLRIHLGQVEKEALEDDEDPHRIHRDSDHGDNPMDVGIGCPSEDEDADWREETADHGWEQDLLGVGSFPGKSSWKLFCLAKVSSSVISQYTFVQLLTYAVVIKICCIRDQSQGRADDKRDESKIALQQVEAVNGAPDQRERLEERVVDPVHQHHVDVCEEDGRVHRRDARRHQESFHDHLFGARLMLMCDLRPRTDEVVAGLSP